MPYAIAGGIISAAGTIYAANQQSDAVSNASNTQAQSTQAALAEQRAAREQAQRNMQPFIDTAHRLLPVYEGEISKPTSSADVMAQPGYQFGLEQGQQAIDRRRAAGGGRSGGAAYKEAARYATNYATTKYGEANSIREARLARLGQLAGMAPITAASNTNQQYASTIGGLLTNQGDATAAGQLARGNIYGGAINQLGAQLNRGLTNYGNSPNRDPAYNASNGQYYPLVQEAAPGQYSLSDPAYG